MNWIAHTDPTTGSKSKHYITSEDGRFWIAKALVNGVDDFMLWDRKMIIDHWPTAQQAKEAARAIVEAESCRV
jgi:hypothetical protein